MKTAADNMTRARMHMKMRAFSKPKFGTKKAPQLDSMEKFPRKITYRSKDEAYPEFNKGNVPRGWIYPLTSKCTAAHLS
jgi:hypothetical protein